MACAASPPFPEMFSRLNTTHASTSCSSKRLEVLQLPLIATIAAVFAWQADRRASALVASRPSS
jgi:hypothetical protein